MNTQENRTLISVVFTDIEGFSALTQKDETQALEHVRRYRKIINGYTKEYRGDVIHFYGDGSLSVHKSSYDAVQCAIKMQQELGAQPRIPVRIGIHLGEVVFTEETIYGNAVNIASRIQHLGSAHSILLSGSIAQEMQNHTDIKTVLIGSEHVKNIKEPVDIHAVIADNLVIPSRQELHDRNKSRKKTPYVVSIILAVAIIASLFSNTIGDLMPWNNDVLDARILVLPFSNETGDSTLDHLSIQAAISINSMLQKIDEIKLVTMKDVWSSEHIKTFGGLPYIDLSRMSNAENFISGHYNYKSDSTFAINCALVNGSNGDIIEQFPEQVVGKNNIVPGLLELGQRIIGYLLSADFELLSPPNQDAFYAFIEAQRVWGQNDYVDSRQYLLRAIDYDSTFIDAYFLLTDAFYNSADFEAADSLFQVVNQRFRIEQQSPRKKNEFYFYEALHAGDYRSAYKYLMNVYEKDKTELFGNTTAGNFSLFYVNDPKQSIKILRKIPFKTVDYELTDQRVRLTTGIQALCALGKYKSAAKLALLYPSNGMTLRHHNLKIRVYAGLLDTIAINQELAHVKLNFNANDYSQSIYWVKQQFTLMQNESLAHVYLNKTNYALLDTNVAGPTRSRALYDLGRVQEGLEYSRYLFDFAPYYLPYVELVGRGYALGGDQDSAYKYLEMMADTTIIEFSQGESAYHQAKLLTTLGDNQGALVRLRRAVNEGLIFYEDRMEFDPILMPLFKDPEFQKINHPLEE